MIGKEKGSVVISGSSSHKMTGLFMSFQFPISHRVDKDPFFSKLRTILLMALIWLALTCSNISQRLFCLASLRMLSRNERGAGLAQWWERSPPTNVSQVRFPDLASYVGWVCCWFSTLFREVFLQVLRFSLLFKNQHFQIPIWSGNAWPRLNEFFELLGAPWVNKLHLNKLYLHLHFMSAS